MKKVSRLLESIVQNWPLKKYLGRYSFHPVFFFAGAGLEFVMIHWTVGETNFYKTYKKRAVESLAQERAQKEWSLRKQQQT